MKALNKITLDDQDPIDLMEHRSKDIIKIARAIEGILELRHGDVVIGITSKQYREMLFELLKASDKV